MEDGYVIRIKRSVVGKVRMEDLIRSMGSLSKKDYLSSPVLPSGNGACRLYMENDKYAGFLMQMNPNIWNIHFDNKKNSMISEDIKFPNKDGSLSFRLSMPWLWVFIRLWRVGSKFQWNKCFIAATYSNINSLYDPVYTSPTPNIWTKTAQMCTGEIMTDDSSPVDSPSILCRGFLFKMPQCWFNDDLPGSPATSVRAGSWVNTLLRWEHATEENPGTALDSSFGMIRYPIGDGDVNSFVENSMMLER